jgi:hypothetical protein
MGASTDQRILLVTEGAAGSFNQLFLQTHGATISRFLVQSSESSQLTRRVFRVSQGAFASTSSLQASVASWALTARPRLMAVCVGSNHAQHGQDDDFIDAHHCEQK